MDSLRESPRYVRCSTAAAMTLGLKRGRFWRRARLHCINLLLTYRDGCRAACAYCGLSRNRRAAGQGRRQGHRQDACATGGGDHGQNVCATDGSRRGQDACATGGARDRQDVCATEGTGHRQDACATGGGDHGQDARATDDARHRQDACATGGGDHGQDARAADDARHRQDAGATDGARHRQDACATGGGDHGQNARATGGTFIRVEWPTYAVRDIVGAMGRCRHAQRVCISMMTHRRALDDTIAVAQAIRRELPIPISGLITPTLVDAGGLERLRDAGIDKIGIAIDAVTPAIFDRLRGKTAGGPHRWEMYWERFEEALNVFGHGNVGSHVIVGLGETEFDLASAFQTVHDLGGVNHLFSFFPEAGSQMEDASPPPIDVYRRAQLAAHLIDSGRVTMDDFTFDPGDGRIRSFGLSPEALDRVIEEGEAFRTRGCTGADGCVACNRPFANSLPGPGIRNYPFAPEAEDVERIRLQLAGEWVEEDTPPVRPRAQPRDITFFAPCIKHFDTDEYTNSGKPVYIACSVTGGKCGLQCLHCRARLLKGTYATKTPEALWELALRLKDKGLQGLLLTGGSNRQGIVPLARFAPTLARLKGELSLYVTVHTKLLDRPLAEALCGSGVDGVLLDVVGSLDMLQRVYRLEDKTLDDIERGLDLLAEYDLPASPHVVLSNLAGANGEGDRALALLDGRPLRSLVVVLLMPLPGCDVGATGAWDLGELLRLFQKARAMFPTTPLLLGCARPAGRLQRQIDALALEAEFDGIAYPSEGTVAEARRRGRKVRFSEFCCSLMLQSTR